MKLAHTTLLLVTSILLFGCTTSIPQQKQINRFMSKKDVKEVIFYVANKQCAEGLASHVQLSQSECNRKSKKAGKYCADVVTKDMDSYLTREQVDLVTRRTGFCHHSYLHDWSYSNDRLYFPKH